MDRLARPLSKPKRPYLNWWGLSDTKMRNKYTKKWNKRIVSEGWLCSKTVDLAVWKLTRREVVFGKPRMRENYCKYYLSGHWIESLISISSCRNSSKGHCIGGVQICKLSKIPLGNFWRVGRLEKQFPTKKQLEHQIAHISESAHDSFPEISRKKKCWEHNLIKEMKKQQGIAPTREGCPLNPGNEGSSEALQCVKGWGECGGFSSRSNNNLSGVLWEFVGRKCYMLFWNETDKDELREKSTGSKHLQLPLKRAASSLIHWEICYRSSKLAQEHLFLLLFFASFN